MALLTLVCVGGGMGCGAGADARPGEALRAAFPEHAGRVLHHTEAFVAARDGFATAIGGDPATAIGRRGGLSAALPRRAEGALRFHVLGGFEVSVREDGASGEGVIAEGAVAYPRRGGTSFWTATEEGYEEWLTVEAGAAAGEPVAAWDVEGAALREANGAVEIAGADGATRIRVTAPIAFAAGGRVVPLRLSVRGARIELWADAAGEALLVDPVWTTTAPTSTARYYHTATVLLTGKVLVAGGYSGTGYLASAELYDPVSATWSPATPMSVARFNATATLLPSGKVLVAGGYSGTSYLASAELYNPATNTWSATGPMVTPRYGHGVVLLGSGKVLAVGGYSGTGYLASAELYNPATNTWSATGGMSAARYGHTATLLATGNVLVTGGFTSADVAVATATLYNTAAGTWSSAARMTFVRSNHAAVLLRSGKVMVTGGWGGSSFQRTAETYDPAVNAWTSTALMPDSTGYHTATVLANGKVLVAGGYCTTYNSLSQLYDPTSNTWTEPGNMISARAYHTATLLSSGKVLVVDGYNTSGVVGSSELFDPSADAWAPAVAMSTDRRYHTATTLPDGNVLVAGGYSTVSGVLSSTDLYVTATDTRSAGGALGTGRYLHTATLLKNGQVLVTGGYGATGILSTAEIYDPPTNTWRPAATLSAGRYGHTATLLWNGAVVVAGGYGSTGYLASVELYDTLNDRWIPRLPMSAARYAATATSLPTLGAQGKVLVAGGYDGVGSLATAEIYDAYNNAWSPAGTMSGGGRYFAQSAVLPSGKVLVAGGAGDSATTATANLYDPSSNTWSAAGALSAARAAYTMTYLGGGRVLAAGGRNSVYLASAEIYDAASNAWLTAAPLLTARAYAAAPDAPLSNGKVLVTGGYNGAGLSSDELYVPPIVDDGNPCTADAWLPAFGQVTHTQLADGTACNAFGHGSGTCASGVCVLAGCDTGYVSSGDGCIKAVPSTSDGVHQFVVADSGLLALYVLWAPATPYHSNDQRVWSGNIYRQTAAPGCTSGSVGPSGHGTFNDGTCVWSWVDIGLPPGVQVETVATTAPRRDFVWSGDLHTSVWNQNNPGIIVGHYMPLNGLDDGEVARCNPGLSNDCKRVPGYDCELMPADVNGHAVNTTNRQAQWWAGEYFCQRPGAPVACATNAQCGDPYGACLDGHCAMTTKGMRTAELDYWLAHHPDWILYRNGATGPTDLDHIAWWGDAPQFPLDFTNAAVQDEMLRRIRAWKGYGTPGQDNTYSALSVDVVYPMNYFSVYGVFRSATLTPLFNGNPGYSTAACGATGYCDPAWNAAVRAWLTRLVHEMHKDGLRVHVNMAYASAQPGGGVAELISPTEANLHALFSTVDGVLDENGFSGNGDRSPTWVNCTSLAFGFDGVHPCSPWFGVTIPQWSNMGGVGGYMRVVQGLGKAYYSKNEFSPAVLRSDQIEWAMASYLLAKAQSASLYVDETIGSGSLRGDPATTFRYLQLEPPSPGIGHPCSDPVTSGAHGFYRQYSHGYVAVNAGAYTDPAVTFTPPSGAYRWDPTAASYTSAAPASISLPYQTGLVLFSPAQLCP